MSDVVGAHNDLHSEQGAVTRRAPGTLPQPGHQGARTWPGWSSRSPTWTGPRPSPGPSASASSTADADELQLRGTDAGAPCVLVRRGAAHPVLRAGVPGRRTRSTSCGWPTRPDAADARTARVARRRGRRADRSQRHRRCRSSPACTTCPNCPRQPPHVFNFGHDLRRTNATQRPPREPARDPAARTRGAAVHQVHRGAELVPRPLRADRQRLPVLPRPARTADRR